MPSRFPPMVICQAFVLDLKAHPPYCVEDRMVPYVRLIMSNLISKEEALRHLQQGQLFLLTILDRKFYVFAPKGSTPEALRAEMGWHDLGDAPDRCYGEIPNAAVMEIQSLDQISEQKHLGWLPYLFEPFGDYVNWIDPTVKECLEMNDKEIPPVNPAVYEQRHERRNQSDP